MAVTTTGFFDGVHLGHQAVLDALKKKAGESGQKSILVTFWPHPRLVLHRDSAEVKLLTTLEEKKKLVLEHGIDEIHVIPFTEELSCLDTAAFMQKYLIGHFGTTSLILGYDHRFGASCHSPQEVQDVAEHFGLDATIIPAYECDGVSVSSTKIRRLLDQGEVAAANRMLGYEYSMDGIVVEGNRIGHQIGFPTANMELDETIKQVPENGVYVVRAYCGGVMRYGICNIGRRPTIGKDNTRTIETNIFDFDREIYGEHLKVEFVDRIRDEKKFASLDELRMQIGEDKQFARRLMAQKER